MSEKNMKISKTAVFLTNEHHSDQNKNIASDFRILFLLCNRSRKTIM